MHDLFRACVSARHNQLGQRLTHLTAYIVCPLSHTSRDGKFKFILCRRIGVIVQWSKPGLVTRDYAHGDSSGE